MPKKKPPVKRVKVYPFQGTIEVAGAPKPVQIVLVSAVGVMVQAGEVPIFVGRNYKMSFQLPTSEAVIQSEVKAVKTFSRAVAIGVERMAELHFLGMPYEIRSQIQTFLMAAR